MRRDLNSLHMSFPFPWWLKKNIAAVHITYKRENITDIGKWRRGDGTDRTSTFHFWRTALQNLTWIKQESFFSEERLLYTVPKIEAITPSVLECILTPAVCGQTWIRKGKRKQRRNGNNCARFKLSQNGKTEVIEEDWQWGSNNF